MTVPRWLWATLVFPIVVLVGNAAWSWVDAAGQPRWDLPVTGYDPIDVLRGHYVQYRYAWPVDATSAIAADTPEETWRLCLSGPATEPNIRFFSNLPGFSITCDAVAREIANHDGMTFAKLDELQRPQASGIFYVSERHAPLVERLLAEPGRKSVVRVRISNAGRVTPIDIFIDGRSFRELASAGG
jgi:hypothetical protein